MRQNLLSVYRQSGVKPKPLIGPSLPNHLAYLWAWFNDLDAGREAGLGGPAPLRNTEILAWCQITGTRLSRWEFRALRTLDNTYLATQAEKPGEFDGDAPP